MKKIKLIIIAVVAILLVMGIALDITYFNEYKTGQWYIINSEGEKVTGIGYADYLGQMYLGKEECFVLYKKNRFREGSLFYSECLCIVDKNGREVLKFKNRKNEKYEYDSLKNVIIRHGKDTDYYPIYDSDGKLIHEFSGGIHVSCGINYHDVVPFSETDYLLGDNDYGYINMQDEVIVEPQFKWADPFTEDGLARVASWDNKYGFIDTKGNIVVPTIYDMATEFSDGMAKVSAGRNAKLIDVNGQTLVELPEGMSCYYCGKGFTSIENKSKKNAIVDKNGEQITDFIFDDVGWFQNGYCNVKIGNLWGYIDTDGNIAIEPKFKLAAHFMENGLAIARISDEEGLYGLIDTSGEWHVEPQFDNIYMTDRGGMLASIPVTNKELKVKVNSWNGWNEHGESDENTTMYLELKKGDVVYNGYGTISVESVSEDDIILKISRGCYAVDKGEGIDLGAKPLYKLTVNKGQSVKISSQTTDEGISITFSYK